MSPERKGGESTVAGTERPMVLLRVVERPSGADPFDFAWAVFRLTDVFALPWSRPELRPAEGDLLRCIFHSGP